MENKNTLGIYISRWNSIGGIERFVQNFCKRMNKHYDITLLYEWVETPDLFKEAPNVNIVQIKRNQQYTFDYFINSTAWGYSPFGNINAKIYAQAIHANYSNVIEHWNFKYVKHEKTTHHFCVGEDVKKAFEIVTPYKCDAIIYNLLDNKIKIDKKPKNKKLTLITCSRLSGEKGFKRMLKLADQLKSNKIDYVWNVYGNTANPYAQEIVKSFKQHPEVIFHGITTEPHKEINKADYLVQLSDTEGFAYSVYEAMQVKTPCIITPFASGKEQITNGVNGYIVPFEMDNIPFDDIIRKDLKVPEFEELGKEEHWISFFDSCLEWYKENVMTVKIIAVVQKYQINEIVDLPKERALSAIERGLAELLSL